MTSIVDVIKTGIRTAMIDAKVAMPGIVKKFYPDGPRADVTLAIQQIIGAENITHPLLFNIPVQFPTAGGFSITFPVKPGDEVMVLFSDRCIDTWVEKGEVSPQETHRVHSISDGVAQLGIKSDPNKLSNYSEDHLEIRNDAGDQYIRIEEGGDIEVKATKLKVGDLDVDGDIDSTGDITAVGDITAGGISLKGHTHLADGTPTSPPQ